MHSIVERDLKYIWHPFTQAATAKAPIAIKSAQGAYLYSEQHGKLFDGISSWWTNAHGHSHPHINQAIARQSEILEHVMFANFTHEPAVNLAEQLIETAPSGLSRVFYSDNGSTAVESGLKMAFQYWYNQGEERTHLIALQSGYHGDTFGAMAAGERSVYNKAFWPWLFNVLRAPSTCVSEVTDEHSEAVITARALEKLDELFNAHPNKIAAVIIEPMLQGGGGMHIFTKGFLKGIKERCMKHGALLIADEVATGFYRTGKRFACDHEEVNPDILCLSKSLTGGYMPLAATLATEEIFKAFLGPNKSQALLHGHTFTGNPLGCAAALASLALFREREVLENIAAIGQTIASEIGAFQTIARVKNARSIGGVAIVELGDAQHGYESSIGESIYLYCLEKKLFIRPMGNVVYFMPPFCAEVEEVRWGLRIMKEAISLA